MPIAFFLANLEINFDNIIYRKWTVLQFIDDVPFRFFLMYRLAIMTAIWYILMSIKISQKKFTYRIYIILLNVLLQLQKTFIKSNCINLKDDKKLNIFLFFFSNFFYLCFFVFLFSVSSPGLSIFYCIFCMCFFLLCGLCLSYRKWTWIFESNKKTLRFIITWKRLVASKNTPKK